MQTHFLETKFHIPPWRESGVTRPRLLQRLQGGLNEHRKLTLVSAPAGYGKTTLIAEWLGTIADNSRIAWLSLDESDNDLSRFLGYWVASLRRVDESLGTNAQSLLEMPQLPPLDSFLDGLINDLSALEDSILLVLDDYHLISNPKIHEALEYFLDHQPAQVHLAMTTREDPPFPLARMRARGQMTEIRAHDLRFTPQEAAQFFNQSMKLDLTPQSVDDLEKRTEGWAVGLQLAGLALQSLPDPQKFIETFRGSHRYVLDYLAEEVLRQQGEDLRRFLAQTSILERLNASLCNALTERSDSQTVLTRLEQSNLFIIPLDNERNWYRYHHLFADYLRTELTKPETAAFHKKAAIWYEENDLVFEAVKYAFLSGNLEMTANVIERVIQKVSAWSGGEITTLVGWLDALPVQLLRSRPALCVHASRAWYIAGQIELSEKYLDLAEQSLRESPTPDLHTGKLLAITAERRASLALLHGDVRVAVERATYALNQLPEEELYDRARAGAMLGLAYGLSGDLEKASRLLIKTSDLAHAAGVSFMTLVSRCEAALVQIIQGKLHMAAQTVRQAMQLVGEKQLPSLGFAWFVLAEIAWERNELPFAEQYLEEGMELSRQGVLIDDLRFELMSLARLKKSTDNLAAAMSAIEQAHSICQSFNIPRLDLLSSAHRVRIQLANGMLDTVTEWARQYQELRNSQQVEYTREYEDLTLARVYLANGKYDQALDILTPLYEQADAAGRIRTCIEAMMLLALFHHAKKDTLSAVDWLGKSLRLAAPEGYARVFLDEGKPLLDLLPKARPAAPEFVDSLLGQNQPEGESRSAPTEQLPDPLSEQEIRVLKLIVAGKSNQEIADELVISVGTAKWHVHNILRKLGVGNRPQAIARVRELGI